MMINGLGYICKKCIRELTSDDVTYYGAMADMVSTKCCNDRPVKRSKGIMIKIGEMWKSFLSR